MWHEPAGENVRSDIDLVPRVLRQFLGRMVVSLYTGGDKMMLEELKTEMEMQDSQLVTSRPDSPGRKYYHDVIPCLNTAIAERNGLWAAVDKCRAMVRSWNKAAGFYGTRTRVGSVFQDCASELRGALDSPDIRVRDPQS